MSARFGDYTIRQPLGNGGMAAVHLADWAPPKGVARRVALKRLYPHIARIPSSSRNSSTRRGSRAI